MLTFAISTLGCKVNSYESIGYEQGLLQRGFQKVDEHEKADVYIINTCAVTNTASAKSRKKIHQAKALNPKALIVVVGCYVQMEANAILEKEGVDILIGSDQKPQLPSLVEEALTNHNTYNMVHDIGQVKAFEALPISKFYEHTRAFLKVQDGCNQFCSYCIIPYARGRERSLPLNDALAIAKNLSASGHREIVLAGIHTGRYGRDLHTDLTTLLKAMCEEVKGLQRIRISSIEMNEISDELIALMKEKPQIARHLHIPIQSGCDKTLDAMHRPYHMDAFKKRIQQIREQLGDDISISSDVIVGFPGESEEDFQETLHNIKEMRLSFLHVFPYSRRDHTVAADMKEQIENKEKKRRASILIEESKNLYATYKTKFIGKHVDVLFETEKDGYLFGHSSEYMPVKVKGDASLLHTMQTVKIDSLDGEELQAVIGGNTYASV